VDEEESVPENLSFFALALKDKFSKKEKEKEKEEIGTRKEINKKDRCLKEITMEYLSSFGRNNREKSLTFARSSIKVGQF